MKSKIKIGSIARVVFPNGYTMDEYFLRVIKVDPPYVWVVVLDEEGELELSRPLSINSIEQTWPQKYLSEETIRDLITGKIQVSQVAKPYPIYCFRCSKPYIATPQDLYEGLRTVINSDYDLYEYMHLLEWGIENVYDFVDSTMINHGIRFLNDWMDEIRFNITHIIFDEDEDIDDDLLAYEDVGITLIEQAEELMEDAKAATERMNSDPAHADYKEDELDNILYKYLDRDTVQDASDEEIQFVRNLIESRIPKDDALAMTVKGRACAGGTRLYECNWHDAEQLYMKAYDLTHSPLIAMDIGGLLNSYHNQSGEPDPDQAFYYYSVAEHAGIPHSQLQIGCLYLNEQFTGFNPMLGCDIIETVVKKSKDEFMSGFIDSCYPEAVLQMAQNILEYGRSHVDKLYDAVQCLMSGVYGISRREQMDGGNEEKMLISGVNSQIEQMISSMSDLELKEHSYEDISQLISRVTSSDFVLNIKGRKQKNERWRITAEHMIHEGDPKRKRFFLALPEYGFTGFVDKLIIRSQFVLTAIVDDEEVSEFDVVVDEIRDDTLYCAGKEVLCLQGDLKIGKPTYPKNKRYLMAETYCPVAGIRIETLCESTSICAGDRVMLMGGDDIGHPGIAEAVYWKNDTELCSPPEDYIHVRKMDSTNNS